MKHDVLAPSVGESITEVSILKWAKKDGDAVREGDIILEIESDKATVEVAAETSGALKVLRQEGETVPVGEKIAEIDTAAQGRASADASAGAAAKGAALTGGAAPGAGAGRTAPAASGAAALSGPAAKKLAAEQGVDLNQVPGTGKGGRVTKGDIMDYQAGARGGAQGGAMSAGVPAVGAQPTVPTSAPAAAAVAQRQVKDRAGDRRVPMSRLRIRIAQRLVEAKQTAAILTTFNEVNMQPVMDVRAKYKDKFKAKHGVPLSFMSFFTRASVEALKEIEAVNASIDGTDIVYHDYQNIGIAVGTDRGLVVPIIKDAGKKGFVDLEKSLAELAGKARDGKLSIADMSDGTFTISNGGVYGSMMSTPILTPPQTGILGMHNIVERPVVENGQIVIRPMMYLALSYDHRLIDGKEAVTFLVRLKQLLEAPEKLGLDFASGL